MTGSKPNYRRAPARSPGWPASPAFTPAWPSSEPGPAASWPATCPASTSPPSPASLDVPLTDAAVAGILATRGDQLAGKAVADITNPLNFQAFDSLTVPAGSSDWLISLSELPDLLGARPVRSELVYLLVSLDREFTAQSPPGRWEDYYARRIAEHFGPGS